jgi:hypothetical protein
MSFTAQGPWKSGHRKLELPMELDLEPHGNFKVEGKSIGGAMSEHGTIHDWQFLVIAGRRAVDPTGLIPVDDIAYESHPDGSSSPARAIASPEIDNLTEGAQAIGGAIGFALGIAFDVTCALLNPNIYVAENPEDVRILESLGTRTARVPLGATENVEVFGAITVDAEFVRALAGRRAVSIYLDALRAGSPAATFRELWRVLELAFQAHGRKLVELLDSFPPVRRLGFERTELDALLTLRGQLSHAASRLGAREIRRGNAEAIKSLGRLWSLVDWVILSKPDASSALNVEELVPLTAFVGAEGAFLADSGTGMAKRPLHPLDDGSPRFRGSGV